MNLGLTPSLPQCTFRQRSYRPGHPLWRVCHTHRSPWPASLFPGVEAVLYSEGYPDYKSGALANYKAGETVKPVKLWSFDSGAYRASPTLHDFTDWLRSLPPESFWHVLTPAASSVSHWQRASSHNRLGTRRVPHDFRFAPVFMIRR